MKKLILLFIAIPVLLAAQNPAPGKREPSTLPLDVPSDQVRKPSASQLPKIDLPEFVITGSASINPPDVQKKEYDESGVYRRVAAENLVGNRDRQTPDLGDRFKQSLLLTGEGLNGVVMGSLGSFFTPSLWASAGFANEGYDLSASARYWRTKGFTRFADGSRASIELNGSVIAQSESPFFDKARVGAHALFDLQKYKFYGSASPAADRSATGSGIRLAARSGIDSPAQLQVSAAFHTFNVADTSSSVTENHAAIGAGGELPVFDAWTLDVHLKADMATLAGAGSRNTSLVALTVGSKPVALGAFFIQPAVSGYAVHGMNDQQGSYFFPSMLFGYRGLKRHTLTLSYHPGVAFTSLRRAVAANPYLSAQSVLRHPVDRLSLSAGIQSEWNDWLVTDLRASHTSSTDVPLYADSSGQRIWTLMYGGTTTMTSLRADAVANITLNDYFAVSATVRSAENSMLGRTPPYIAGFEGSVLYRHTFPWGIALTPSVSVVGPRKSAQVVSADVGTCFSANIRAEYLGISGIGVVLNIENLFDQKYQVWNGYDAEPFRMSLGVAYRW